jgi:hypothetical protein
VFEELKAVEVVRKGDIPVGIPCEHTRILRALVEYPQGNLEEIQEKTLKST